MSASIRAAAPHDSAAIAALHIASWRSAYRGMLTDAYLDGPIEEERARLWRARLDRPEPGAQRVLIAEEAGSPIGFACALRGNGSIWGACLDNLHVRPDMRGGGVGRLLFARAAQWVIDTAPGSPLHLWVFEGNQPACRFYARYDGQVAERRHRTMPDGSAPAALRYVWGDLPELVRQLEG